MTASFFLAFGIGIVAGLRSMTAPAWVAWGARLDWLKLEGSPFSGMGSAIALAAFSLFAVGELIADKLPTIPRRTAPIPLLTRILMGGLCGGCLCASANQSIFPGVILGGIGALVGAFGGYEIRKRLVSGLGIADPLVAVVEDLFALGLAFFLVSR